MNNKELLEDSFDSSEGTLSVWINKIWDSVCIQKQTWWRSFASLISSKHTLKGRFRKVIRLLAVMQDGFYKKETGINIDKLMSGKVEAFNSNIFGQIGAKLRQFVSGTPSKSVVMGLKPFCEKYKKEISVDYEIARDTYNKMIAAAQSETKGENDGGNKLGSKSSFRDILSKKEFTESKDKSNISGFNYATVGAELVVRGGQYHLRGEDSDIIVQVTSESTRELCYVIFNNFFSKYIDFEQLTGKSLSDISDGLDDETIAKYKKLLTLYSTPNSNSANKMFKRIEEQFSIMCKHYYKMGSEFIKNFRKFSNGGENDERHNNRIVASFEKLSSLWDSQKDVLNNALPYVIGEITSDENYKNYITFIADKVLPIFKTGSAGDADYMLDAMPKKGEYYIVSQTGDKKDVANNAVVEITSDYDNNSQSLDLKIIGLFRGHLGLNSDGTYSIKELKDLVVEWYDNKFYENVKYFSFLSLDPRKITNFKEFNNRTGIAPEMFEENETRIVKISDIKTYDRNLFNKLIELPEKINIQDFDNGCAVIQYVSSGTNKVVALGKEEYNYYIEKLRDDGIIHDAEVIEIPDDKNKLECSILGKTISTKIKLIGSGNNTLKKGDYVLVKDKDRYIVKIEEDYNEQSKTIKIKVLGIFSGEVKDNSDGTCTLNNLQENLKKVTGDNNVKEWEYSKFISLNPLIIDNEDIENIFGSTEEKNTTESIIRIPVTEDNKKKYEGAINELLRLFKEKNNINDILFNDVTHVYAILNKINKSNKDDNAVIVGIDTNNISANNGRILIPQNAISLMNKTNNDDNSQHQNSENDKDKKNNYFLTLVKQILGEGKTLFDKVINYFKNLKVNYDLLKTFVSDEEIKDSAVVEININNTNKNNSNASADYSKIFNDLKLLFNNFYEYISLQKSNDGKITVSTNKLTNLNNIENVSLQWKDENIGKVFNCELKNIKYKSFNENTEKSLEFTFVVNTNEKKAYVKLKEKDENILEIPYNNDGKLSYGNVDNIIQKLLKYFEKAYGALLYKNEENPKTESLNEKKLKIQESIKFSVTYITNDKIIESAAFNTGVNRKITANKDCKNWYVFSECAWSNGNDMMVKKILANKVKGVLRTRNNKNDLSEYAKANENTQMSNNFADMNYSVKKPGNLHSIVGCSLYECAVAVKFNNNDVISNVIPIGISKIN